MSHTPQSDFELYYSACAAAPEMLEALEQTYATIENRSICPFCGCALDHRHDCIAILIQTAIQKARGEE